MVCLFWYNIGKSLEKNCDLIFIILKTLAYAE